MRRSTPPATPARTRTIAYVRVSTDKQAELGVSLEAQRAKLEAYAALYDLDLVAVEVDAASACDLDRPALTRALAELRAGRADALLVVKLDRLTRSVRDLGDLVERCTRERWALLSVGDAVDTRTAAGRLVLNVLASVAQWEREAIGERTAAAMAYMRERLEYTGGRVRYGYTVSADGRALERNEAEQAVVAAAVELRAAGLSLREVGAALAARGLYPRTGAVWHATTIKLVLAVAA
jgi:DNA invertase Pin-like site-specific DNA recombinase